MSRSRRESKSQSSKSQKKSSSWLKGFWWKGLIAIFMVFVISAIFTYKKVVAFLYSDEFKQEVSEVVDSKLGTTGELGDFSWSGLNGENKSYNATGDGLISVVDVKDVAFDVKLDYIKRDKFRIKNIKVGDIYAEIDVRKPYVGTVLPKKKRGFFAGLLPEEVEILDAELLNVSAKVATGSGDYEVSGVSVEAAKVDTSFKAVIDGGRLNLPFSFLRSANIVRGELVQLDNEVYVNDVELKIFKSGDVVLNGLLDISPGAKKAYDIDGVLSGLSCSDVFPKSWHQHLTGEVMGKLKIVPGANAEPKVEGYIEILDGQLRALPVLDKMAQYLSSDYQTIHFEKFVSNFNKNGDYYKLRDMELVSKGLIQVEGDLDINGRTVAGTFDVGIPSKNLAALPGARGNVFKSGKDGLYWASVKIGGTTDNITNDIVDRLKQAAVNHVVNNIMELGGNIADPEIAKKMIEQGLDSGLPLESIEKNLLGDKSLLEGGTGIVKDVLKGLTGSNKNDDEDAGENKSILPDAIDELPIPKLRSLPRLPF